MNILSAILDAMISFIRNNPLTVVIIVMLAVFVPSLFGAVLIGLLVVLLLIVAWPVAMLLRLRRKARRMERDGSARDFGREYTSGSRRNSNPDEGEVKIYATSVREKRVRSDVGDYVEFEEITSETDTKS
ncbi:MAG: hypothetical protein BHV70_07645 [Bacteroidales bacterium 55_9]|nr:MAG: hypothetical protein BHV70_07645 [Bacteroidales bacterium 55_9]